MEPTFNSNFFSSEKHRTALMGHVYNAGVEEFQVEMVHQNTSYVMAVSSQSCLIHDHEVGSGKNG